MVVSVGCTKKIMKIKKKTCDGCGNDHLIWKNHEGKRYCKNCWLRSQAVTGKKNKPTNNKPLARHSLKRAKQERDYSKIRKAYLLSSNTCKAQLPNTCTHHSTEVHHKMGRIGDLLTNIKYWLPVCRQCHQWIEEHPIEAKELGFSLNRLA